MGWAHHPIIVVHRRLIEITVEYWYWTLPSGSTDSARTRVVDHFIEKRRSSKSSYEDMECIITCITETTNQFDELLEHWSVTCLVQNTTQTCWRFAARVHSFLRADTCWPERVPQGFVSGLSRCQNWWYFPFEEVCTPRNTKVIQGVKHTFE